MNYANVVDLVLHNESRQTVEVNQGDRLLLFTFVNIKFPFRKNWNYASTSKIYQNKSKTRRKS